MATLYKKPGQNTWTARLCINWKRMDKQTHHAARRDAAIFAASWEKEVRAALKKDTLTTDRFTAAGERLLRMAREGTLTLDGLKKWSTEVYQIAHPEFTAPSLRDTTQAWLDRQTKCEPGTRQVYQLAITGLLTALPDKADKPAHTVTREDLERARDTASAGRSYNTIRIWLSTWRRILGDAAERNGWGSNPAAKVEGPATDNDAAKRGPFSVEEMGRLLATAEQNNLTEWFGLILVAANTGLRMMDCARLTKSSVQDGLLIIRPEKTKRMGKVISIPVHPDLQEWINQQPADQLFPGLLALDDSTISGRFKRLMHQAGVQDKVPAPGGATLKRSFHSIRHFVTSYLAGQGLDSATRQLILGHSSAKQTAEYTRLTPDQRRAMFEVMPSFRTPAPTNPAQTQTKAAV